MANDVHEKSRGAGEQGSGESSKIRVQIQFSLARGLADDRLKRFRQIVNQIAGDHRYLPKFLRGQVAGQSVNVHAQPRGIERRESLAEQGGDDASEHIAGAAGCHAGVAGLVDAEPRAIRHDVCGL